MAIDSHLHARDVMTSDVICLRGDMSVLEAAQTLTQAGVSGAPVVDDEGRLLGLVSEEDLMGAFYEGDAAIASVALVGCVVLGAALITRRVVSVKAETPVHDIARAMIIRKIKRVPVLDQERRVIGIVSRRDVLRAMAKRAAEGAND